MRNCISAFLTVGMLIISSVSFAQDTVAIVTGTVLRIRKEPRIESVAFAAFPYGERVVIIDDKFDGTFKGGWVKVRTNKSSQGYGYMSSRFLTLESEFPKLKKITEIETAPARMVFSLAAPNVSEQEAIATPNNVGGAGNDSLESKIKADIGKLTESLVKEGKEADIRSVVVLYNSKPVDADKNELRKEVKSLYATIIERERDIDRLTNENRQLKDQLSEKDKILLGKAKLEGERAVSQKELNRKNEGPSNSSDTVKDIIDVKDMIAKMQQQITDMMKPIVIEKSEEVQKARLDELAKLKNTVALLTNMPDFKLINIVETSGEEVFLKGVGKVKMATDGDLTIFSVPKSKTKNGEKLFAHALKRIVNGGESVFFICDKGMVQSAEMKTSSRDNG